MKDIDTQMQALDDFVTRARSQNTQHHDSHVRSLGGLSATVKSSYGNIGTHFTSTYERVRDLGDEMSTKTGALQDSLSPLDSILQQPLIDLRSNITNTTLQEYQPTGETPQKVQYQYPTELPKTQPHENLLAAIRRPRSTTSPSKPQMVPVIFNDAMDADNTTATSASSITASTDGRPNTAGGLRELDMNTLNLELQGVASSGGATSDGTKESTHVFKRSVGKLPVLRSGKKSVNAHAHVVPAEGRENNAILAQQSTGRRRSPRTG
jgi:kinesin family member 11